MKTLIAVDGSKHITRLIAYMVEHPELPGSKPDVTLFTVVPELPAQGYVGFTAEELYNHVEKEADAVLNTLVKFMHSHEIFAKRKHTSGYPGRAIAQEATDGKYDLVLMGSRGHGTVLNMVLGSETNYVLTHCKVPLLIVH